MKRKKRLKQLILCLALLFIGANVIAALHAYRFTHFTDAQTKKVKPESLSFGGKLSALFFGANNPRPENTHLPSGPYETIAIGGDYPTKAWYMKVPDAKGTVLICHGYSSSKSDMLEKASYFMARGYHTLLIDFMGAGDAAGNRTTIGFDEAKQVAASVAWLRSTGEKNIIPYGISMGAVAIMKYAAEDTGIKPQALILECPFGTMKETVEARFRIMKLPAFPMADLLLFWGGVENGFDAFEHNPETYAKKIQCPVLLLYGEKDLYVSRSEMDTILQHLPAAKMLKTYPLAGHENYWNRYKDQWMQDVDGFLASLPSR